MSKSLSQSAVGLELVRLGLGLSFTGMLYGGVIHQTPFPRLALTAHLQLIQNGIANLGVGLLLFSPQIYSLSPRSLKLVKYCTYIGCVPMIAEMINAWWGARQILPIAADSAGAVGSSRAKELFVTLMHVIPAPLGLMVYGILLWNFPTKKFLK